MKLHGEIPYHVQIKKILENEIINGKYTDKIPSELDLMERFDVSRSTVRQAVSTLVNEGLLEKKHGKGTFVSFRPVMDWLGSFKTYREIITEMGMTPYIQPIKTARVMVPTGVEKVLDTKEAFLVKRIRYADSCPISVEENYYPLDLEEKIKDVNWENVASYNILQSAGVILWNAKQIITGRMPTPEEMDLLKLNDNVPILYIERLNYNNEHQIVEYERSSYRADKYSFVVHFGRDGLV